MDPFDRGATAGRLVADFTEETADWIPESAAELVDFIVATHHAYLRRELPRLACLLEKLSASQGARQAELRELRAVFIALHGHLIDHMNRQERFVFPLIKRLAASGPAGTTARALAESISTARREHEQAGAALAWLRSLTGGYAPPADACACHRALLAGLSELETDMRSHVQRENNILFPRVLAATVALSAATEAAMA
jgi:regulator of cell morphogenesis and NO signaling